jgi:TP53 regulating kinase-like protein
LLRCRRAGLRVPAVLLADTRSATLVLERIDGVTLKDALDAAPSPEACVERGRALGALVARLHGLGVVHGDLTTSNVMVERATDGLVRRGPLVARAPCTRAYTLSLPRALVRPFSSPPQVLLDFGLCSTGSVTPEDVGVDLYVLERSLASAHPLLPHLVRACGRQGCVEARRS